MISRNLIVNLFTVLISTLLPTFYAYANGGPVAWTGVTPVGAVGLSQDSDIILRSEVLKIDVTGFNTYKVRAEYELQNEGSKKTVLFGVPLTWPEKDNNGWVTKHSLDKVTAKEEAEKIAEKISIRLNGKDLHCSLSESAIRARKSDRLVTSLQKELELDNERKDRVEIDTGKMKGKTGWVEKYVEKDHLEKEFKVDYWCVASLPFESKKTATLVLEYSAELLYGDEAYTKSALTVFGIRRLQYLFYPAGYWKGPVKTVNITVDTGPYPSFKLFKGPTGHRVDGRTLSWSLKNVDFKSIPKLELFFPPEPVAKDELLTWNQLPDDNGGKIPMKVKASSTLPDTENISYKPENVLDGKGETAWCKGVAGSGVGQWLKFNFIGFEVESTSPSDPSKDEVLFDTAHMEQSMPWHNCRIEGIVFTPGYLKSQKSYVENARIRKVLFTDCDGKQPYEYTIDLPKDYEMAPVLLEMPRRIEKSGVLSKENKVIEPLEYIQKTGCFRLVIQEVEKGTTDDACISEVSVVRHCW
jgi:hypothetical protein